MNTIFTWVVGILFVVVLVAGGAAAASVAANGGGALGTTGGIIIGTVDNLVDGFNDGKHEADKVDNQDARQSHRKGSGAGLRAHAQKHR